MEQGRQIFLTEAVKMLMIRNMGLKKSNITSGDTE